MEALLQKTQQIKDEVAQFSVTDAASLEQFRIQFLGTKGSVKEIFGELKNVPVEQKKEMGQVLNALKQETEAHFETLKETFGNTTKKASISIDATAPAYDNTMGSRHPISIVRDEIISIFSNIGFTVFEGPEIEDDWHNFTALNTPKDHPARDMQDTFYLAENKETLLRTHTSSAQIRALEKMKPPVRIITPGRVYRNETISARAHCTFHQVEGLYIDKKVSFADLKQTILYFAKEMFGSDNIRLRPSFFPFTEPSAEMDISCFICDQKGCNVCKHTGWVEIGGCGMVDPEVLKNCNIDPEEYTGFAFGMGVERITMLKYQINDIRLFWENDVRFLNQFRTEV